MLPRFPSLRFLFCLCPPFSSVVVSLLPFTAASTHAHASWRFQLGPASFCRLLFAVFLSFFLSFLYRFCIDPVSSLFSFGASSTMITGLKFEILPVLRAAAQRSRHSKTLADKGPRLAFFSHFVKGRPKQPWQSQRERANCPTAQRSVNYTSSVPISLCVSGGCQSKQRPSWSQKWGAPCLSAAAVVLGASGPTSTAVAGLALCCSACRSFHPSPIFTCTLPL